MFLAQVAQNSTARIKSLQKKIPRKQVVNYKDFERVRCEYLNPYSFVISTWTESSMDMRQRGRRRLRVQLEEALGQKGSSICYVVHYNY